ncbi:MAG: hypothetical protein AMS18_03810 [Gemmatimonas sp. SG8_17]|nr:MAG: hypothetical protein AMS18_03810 [Gemmatimonas sp. SG8_17]
MAPTRPPFVTQFSRRIAVETPEHVLLEFELAGLGSRAAAAIYDLVIVLGLSVLASLGFGTTHLLPDATGAWLAAFLIASLFAIVWGYFALFEGLGGGRTPGKRRLGIRVIMDTGHPITFYAAAIRNVIRLVDIQPAGSSLLGMSLVFLHPQNKRLGDLAAGTVVVRDADGEIAGVGQEDNTGPVLDVGQPVLTDDEFRLLEQFLDRIDSLPASVRLRFAVELHRRFRKRIPEADTRAEDSLISLHNLENTRRRSHPATRNASQETRPTGLARRFVALRRGTWESLRSRGAYLQKTGLTRLTGAEVRSFAAQYREVAADLARARTYGVDTRVVEHLERVVALGHNVLYGMRGAPKVSARSLVLNRFPAAVVQARAYVLAAFLLFAVPGLVGFMLLREQPGLAADIMPPGMVARAEAGERMTGQGRGYAETASPYLPIVASNIVANNVQVAFGAFAFGILAGIGTVILLAFNGFFFGSVLGLFSNYGLLGWILTFVAGHGILELTAIFIAGAGGLLIGRAIVAPGDMARRDALVVHGRLAIKLVGAATMLLLMAGLIEGFLSASDAHHTLKLGVSAASVVLLTLFAAAGHQACTGEDAAAKLEGVDAPRP